VNEAKGLLTFYNIPKILDGKSGVKLRTVYTKTQRIGLGCSFEENRKETKRVASVWFQA